MVFVLELGTTNQENLYSILTYFRNVGDHYCCTADDNCVLRSNCSGSCYTFCTVRTRRNGDDCCSPDDESLRHSRSCGYHDYDYFH